ncbi:hypothetical protein T12_16511, partial [Trichinella patagoniensis]
LRKCTACKFYRDFWFVTAICYQNAKKWRTVWYYSVPLFSYWSLPTLFYWTVKSLSYWFSLSNCSL